MIREPIYAALFTLASGAANFVTVSRRLRHWSDVGAAEQPALFMIQKSETAEERSREDPEEECARGRGSTLSKTGHVFSLNRQPSDRMDILTGELVISRQLARLAGLFHSREEWHYVTTRLLPRINAEAARNGYANLGIGSFGDVRSFRHVSSFRDFRSFLGINRRQNFFEKLGLFQVLF